MGNSTLYLSQHLLFVTYAPKSTAQPLCTRNLDVFSISVNLRNFFAVSGKMDEMEIVTSCIAVA